MKYEDVPMGIQKIGEMFFTFPYSRMEIGDPCYMGDKVQTNFVRGNYHCFINMIEQDDWGKRVQRMWVVHEKFVDQSLAWLDSKTNFGVDAGLMSINVGDYLKYDDFLNKWDELTPNRNEEEGKGHPHANIIDSRHFVSSSGYGDGYYPSACARENGKTGLIIAYGVIFIEDETHPYFTDTETNIEVEMNR